MEKARLNTKLLSTLNSVLFMQANDIRNTAGIAKSTWYDIMARPGDITVQHLLSIANGLHIPVRRFFFTGRADVIGRRDDYITEPYKNCWYDGEALRDTINERQDATWRRAGEIAGMNYQSIQKSLSSETRTPVVRFFAVCEAFDIDPFTILVDPNPVPEQKRRTGRRDPAVLEEIAAMREEMGRLSETVSDITAKYEALLARYDDLLDAHRILLERFNEHVHDSRPAIAAEPLSPTNDDK